MAPMKLACLGLLLVVFDFRFNGFDLLPDPIGWAIAAYGVSRLTHRHPNFGTGAAVAAAAAVISVFQEWLVFTPGHGVLGIMETVANMAFVWFVLGGIIAVAGPAGAEETVTIGRVLRQIYVGFTLVVLVFSIPTVLANGGRDVQLTGGASLLLVPVVLIGLSLWLWFIYFCWRRSDTSYLSVEGPPDPLGPIGPLEPQEPPSS